MFDARIISLDDAYELYKSRTLGARDKKKRNKHNEDLERKRELWRLSGEAYTHHLATLRMKPEIASHYLQSEWGISKARTPGAKDRLKRKHKIIPSCECECVRCDIGYHCRNKSKGCNF